MENSTRRVMAAAAIAGAMALSACAPMQEPAAEATASPAQSAAPSETVGPSLPGGDIIESDMGAYLQSTITDDDPGMLYNPLVVEPSTHDWVSLEDQKSAWQFAVRFLAVEVLDSPLNGRASSVDSWWDEHKDYYDPAWQESIRGDFDEKQGKGPVISFYPLNGVDKFVYSPLETRLSDRSIKVDRMYYSDKQLMVVETSYDGTFKIITPEGPGSEPFHGTYVFGLTPSDTNGHGWSISYYHKKLVGGTRQ